MIIKTSEDVGSAFDRLAICEVKNINNPSSNNTFKMQLLEKEIREQIGEEIFLEIKTSKRYRKLFKTNEDIFNAVEKAKKNAISASTVDYLNWVRYIHKTYLQREFFNAEFQEVKIGYESFNFIEIDNSHLFFLLDKEDFELFDGYKVSEHSSKYPFARGRVAHRLIMEKYFSIPEDMQVDHINNNKMDARKNNLRICSRSENMRNRFISNKNTTGYKGVFKPKNKNIWRVSIRIDNKQKFIGSFENPRDAAIAYDIAAIKIYGEFAKINGISASEEEIEKIKDILNDTKRQKNRSSKFRGVSWAKDRNKWVAYITHNKKEYNLGYYEKEEDAALAVDRKLVELRSFHRLNFNKKVDLIF